MEKRIKIFFLMLVLVQGLHSMEEYLGKLWEVFLPARFLTGLISNNHEAGFLVANIGLLFFGLWCWYIPVLKNYSFARGLILFWVVVEIINGIGHTVWALIERAYVPGVVTAPILFILAIYLLKYLLRSNLA